MTLEELLTQLASVLAQIQLPYMLTGSVASSAHGTPRSTRDVDVVIAPNEAQLRALIQQFPSPRYYADELQALDALAHRSQFNVIDLSSGWKIDFIVREDSEYGRTALDRRTPIEIAGSILYVSSPEDVLIAKLRWAKLGGSDLQVRDAAGILTTQGANLDAAYLEHWVRELGLDAQWRAARETSL